VSASSRARFRHNCRHGVVFLKPSILQLKAPCEQPDFLVPQNEARVRLNYLSFNRRARACGDVEVVLDGPVGRDPDHLPMRPHLSPKLVRDRQNDPTFRHGRDHVSPLIE